MKFNGMTREEKQDACFMNEVPYFYRYNMNTPNNNIHIYSFSHNPNEYMPTGSVNFSHLQKVNLILDLNQPSNDEKIDYKYDIIIYNRYYNILKLKSGIAELVFFK